MARFYDITSVEQQLLPSALPTPHLPVDYGAGVPNSYTGNDYRNRMPFHFEEDGEDFYGWQYGQTMELVITFGGEPPLEEQPYVTDVLRTVEQVAGSTKTIVDKDTKIAYLNVNSMAFADASLYARKSYFSARLTELMVRLNVMRSDAVRALNILSRIQEELAKGDEMNSKLIEELQRQIVELKESTEQRFTEFDKKFSKEIEDIKQELSASTTELEKQHDADIAKVYDTFTREITWKFTPADWTTTGEYFHFERTLPIEDASLYDITASIAVEETYEEKNVVSYVTGHMFNWFILDNNRLVIYTTEPKQPGMLSVYMTKKTS